MSDSTRRPDHLSNPELERVFATALLEITLYRCRCQPHHDRVVRVQPAHAIAFPHSGAFELVREGRRTLIDSNVVVFHNARVPYTTNHPVGGGDTGSALVVREDVLFEMLDRYDPGIASHRERPFTSDHAPTPSRAVLRERLLLRHVTAVGPPDALAAEETALLLVDQVIKLPFRGAAAGRAAPGRDVAHRKAIAEGAKVLLAARFKERLSLGAIAAELHASPFHLGRVFRSETGLTVHRYLTRLRLREALHRLWSSDADLTTLALDLGFDTHSHFTAAFRREFGVTPRAVREVRVTTAELRRIVRELEADAKRIGPGAPPDERPPYRRG